MNAGAWDIDEVIALRWDAQNLDFQFAGFWDSPEMVDRFTPLNDTEAASGTPFPYCVYETDKSPGDLERMSGADDVEKVNVISNVGFEFRIHAQTKEVAVALAKLVTTAFDNAMLTGADSCVIRLVRGQDFGTRLDDEQYGWTIPYTAVHDYEVTADPE